MPPHLWALSALFHLPPQPSFGSLFQPLILDYPVLTKIISPVLRLRATPVGMPSRVMMTMASLMDHPPPSRHQPGPSTTSQPFSTSPESTVTKFDVCYIDNKSSSIPSILREIPTRNSLPDSLDPVVNPHDSDNDERNTKTTTMLHPTYLEGNAAPLPYQLEIAAISTAVATMKQCDNNITPHMHSPPHQPFDTQSKLAAMSTAID